MRDRKTGKFKKTKRCKLGHNLKKTRVVTKGGSSYCKACLAIRTGAVRNNPLLFERRRRQARKSQLKIQYGITLQDEIKLFTKQNNKCAICESKNHKALNWSIDHDHNTNKVRAILCNTCNAGLGMFKDNPIAVYKAYKYLRLHKARGHT